jgi:hypothetical protein
MRRKATKKPTLYLDSNILSVMHYRSNRIAVLHHQLTTREWWETERKFFHLYGSPFTETELRRGEYAGQKQAIALVRRLAYLPITPSVEVCARTMLDEDIVPANKPGDATQLAVATIHCIDYLLTWNYAHLANANTQLRLMALCRKQQWRAPLLVSPESIPRRTLGQTIRRRDDE